MNKTKSKSNTKSVCANCIEERRKGDTTRKYAHELKNIFITISTVVNSEMECPTMNFSSISGNTSHIAESGDVSPFIMEGRRHRINTKTNNNNINNTDSPFYFLKTLCDYGKTLIKEINELGKDIIENKGELKPFNIAKAIDFCVDMFDTKRKYDKTKKHLQIYSDINFSYDKEVQSISETGFKMVLINLLTNSYKFTTKGKIIVRAVSIPKEKKIRILVKDSGRGFNPKEFIKNGCFYVIENNQELNPDGSGLGLTIVNEILTKFNIKMECRSIVEKGSLFYFDLDDSYPYYDEINPQDLMTGSLIQIINDINSGKKDNELSNINSPKHHHPFKENIINLISVNEDDQNEEKEKKNSNQNSNNKTSNKNLNLSNSNKIHFNNNNKHRFSFMDLGEANINCSPSFNNTNNSNYNTSNNTNSNTNINIHKTSENKVSLKNLNNPLEKNAKNLNVNIYNVNNTTHFFIEKISNKAKKGSISTNDNNYSTGNNTLILTPNKKKIDRFYSIERQLYSKRYSGNIYKREPKPNTLKQIIESNQSNQHRYKKMKTFNLSGQKAKEMHVVKGDNKKKSIDYVFNNLIEREDENDDLDIQEIKEEIKIMNKEKQNQNKNYKKLLDTNFNKTRFYLFELKNIFRKNEIYIHLSLRKNKRCTTEPSSERGRGSPKKLKTKKSFYNSNNNKVYIIICDDEEFVARSARELIINYYTKKGKDPHVYFTPNGIECLYLMYKLTIIENRKIEYILMDLEMPYLNGVKTCNIIKSIKETNVPVYILSGDEPNDCSANGYCNKPLNEIDIINKLDKDHNCK